MCALPVGFNTKEGHPILRSRCWFEAAQSSSEEHNQIEKGGGGMSSGKWFQTFKPKNAYPLCRLLNTGAPGP
jgi:hypothetical protein